MMFMCPVLESTREFYTNRLCTSMPTPMACGYASFGFQEKATFLLGGMNIGGIKEWEDILCNVLFLVTEIHSEYNLKIQELLLTQ